MKKIQVFTERLERLFDVVLKIKADDYRIVINGSRVDVYFRNDNLITFKKDELTIALQTLEIFDHDGIQVEYHWCLSAHRLFDGRAADTKAERGTV